MGLFLLAGEEVVKLVEAGTIDKEVLESFERENLKIAANDRWTRAPREGRKQTRLSKCR